MTFTQVTCTVLALMKLGLKFLTLFGYLEYSVIEIKVLEKNINTVILKAKAIDDDRPTPSQVSSSTGSNE